MADMANIVDFNNSDGLPPWVIQKLNHNFWGVVQKIVEDQVVMVASVTEPSPRTDETLWYKTDTGDLYIWREFEGEWGWDKIDIGYIHVDPDDPVNSTYTRKNEYLWISKNSNDKSDPLWIWILDPRQPDATDPTWISISVLIGSIVVNGLSTNMSPIHSALWADLHSADKIDWETSAGFCNAVKDIIANPNNYPITP